MTLANNLIGNLTAPAATGSNAVIGINITGSASTSNYNVYYNTVYVNNTTSGAGFGSSGISTLASSTATTSTLNLRNNIIVNTSVQNGAGLTVAYRRSAGTAGTLANYGSTSNNNDFYAGTPSATNVVYFDGTSTGQSITDYKNGVFTAGTIAPRDSASFSENPPFLSTTGSSANFLHINTTVPTQLESGAAPIAGITDDFDGDTRNASTPDVGADEFAGILLDLSPPAISYTPFGNTASTGARMLTATITDASGVPTSGAGLPVLYWRINGGSYNSAVATSLGGNQYQFTFGSGVTTGDMVFYYVVAQDSAGTPNVGSNPSAGASGFTANPPAASTPPTTPNSYTILGTIMGSFNVGTGQTYADLTAAITDLNSKVMTGPVTFILTDTSYSGGAGETIVSFPLTINANPGSSAANTITIKPAPGVVATITGSVASGALITIKASYCTIDGSNMVGGSDRSLTITNTNTTSPSVVLFGSTGTTPVTDDTLKNCIIVNGAQTSSAVVISDGTTLGNAGFFSNITIQNNDVQKAFVGVFATGGTTPQGGSNLVYTQNTLNTSGANAIRNVGLYMQGVNGATVSNNTVGNFEAATAENDVGIWLATGTINATVSGNTLSALNYTGTSTVSPVGINVTSTIANSADIISGNSVMNMSSGGSSSTSLVCGISVSGTTGGITIEKNNVQNILNTNTASWPAVGINLNGGNNNIVRNNFVANVKNDQTAGTGAFGPSFGASGIRLNAGTGHQVHSNSVHLYGAMGGTVSTNMTIALAVSATSVTGCDVRDNVLSNQMTGGASGGNTRFVAINLPSSGTSAMNLTLNNNAYYEGTDANCRMAVVGTTSGSGDFAAVNFNPGAVVPPTNFRSYSSTLSAAGTNDNASLATTTAAPFVSNTDLHLSSHSVAAANAGTPIGSVTTDIDGNSRSAMKPDIGADEIASNKLSNLVPGMGSLNETFDPDITSYTETVSNATNSITFTPTVQDSNASVTVNGNPVPSGMASDPIPLNVGMNTVTVVVTPEFGPFSADQPNAGTPNTYTVVVTRLASANADLSDLMLSAGAFSPPFDPATTSYTLSVPNATTSTTVTPTAADPNATIQVRVNGGMYSPVPSGGTSGALALNVGMNTVDVKVTAQDTTTMKVYTVTVTRAPSSNANLSSLVLSDGTLVPAFDPNTTSYAASVPNSTSSITVTPTVQDPTATVTINGMPVVSGMASDPINLAVGSNMISIVVSAQDEMGIRTPQTTKTYTVDVTRATAVSSNANLSDLVLSAGAIMPVFDPDTISYTLTVPNATTSTTVTPTAQDAGATITVNGSPIVSGNASDPIALAVGDNVITTVVTAADTTTMKTYTVTVHRAGPVTTNGASGLAPDYASLADAITALNAATITDPVVITLNGNETAPAGGYAITQQGGTAANTITIQGNASTITASPVLVAGALNDAIFKLIGGNWITLQNFTMQENPANTVTTPASNNMTEWGVALLHASLTQGSQNNTIQNNTISLNKIYGNTFGVYSNNRHSATNITVAEEVTNNTTGPASGNKVYTNGISNVAHGIIFIGSATAANMDVGNDIGGPVVIDSPSVATGNAVSNYGGLPAATAYVGYPTTIVGGAYVLNENNYNVSNNSFISASLNTATALRGILTDYGAVPVGAITNNVINNTVTFTQAGAGGMQCITTAATAGAMSNVTMNLNSNKAVNNAVTTAGAVTIFGVANLGPYGTLNMNNNEVSGNTSAATTGGFVGVTNQGAVVNTVNILNNDVGTETVNAATFSAATTGGISAITNTAGAATATVNMNGNNIRRFSLVSSGQAAGLVQQAATVGVAINMNNNHIGTATSNSFTYSAASSGAFFGLVNAAGAATATLTMSGNDVRGFVQNVTGSGSHNYLNNQVFTGSTNINNNTITNITANTTGSVTMIGNSVTHAANSTHNVNNNSIVTGYSKTGVGGTVLFYNAFGSSGSTVTETNTGNNFSNMTFTGATSIAGWRSADGTTPGSRKTITNNTFSNITGGTSAISSILYVGFSDNTFAANNVSGNAISNISGAGSISAIFSDGQNQNFFNNSVSGLSSTGAAAVVTGIQMTGATTQNIFKNKIYDLQSNGATATVNGILVSSGTTFNIYDNLIGDLRAPSTSSATDAIRGINLTSTTSTSTLNVSYNTIYLSAAMGGANFSTSGIFHTTSGTATTAALNLRNNVVVNNSIANGTGVAAAYRRSNATLTNYGPTSNNNDFYAGTPSASHLVFFDGTNSDQTIQAYRARVASRDSASFTENPPFLSTTGSDPTFLHINSATATHLESMAANVAGITDDYDNDIRQGNPGYAGTGTAPDVGADEFGGMALAFNADLSNLTLSDGMLSPDFDPAITSYTAMVPNSTTSITETPTSADSTSTITVNGNPVVSGTPSGSIPLAVGPNAITTVVTAQDGTTMKTYTVTVTRAASTNADLSNLTLSDGMLSPDFDPAITSYTASVPNSTTSITETPTAADANATITVNGDPVASGMASAPIPLNVGMNTITTVVTAPAGNMKTYTVVVTRAPSSNANLSNLVLSAGAIMPAFDPDTTDYTLTVPFSTMNTTVTPTVQDPTATVTVNGTPVASGTPSDPINLSVGMNTITVVVSAQDEMGIHAPMTTKTYTVVVTREARPPAAIVYVDDDWTGLPNGVDPDAGGPATEIGYDAFATIQDGINGVANPGTVIVYAGNYFENPNVNKELNIMGPNAGIPGSSGSRVAEAYVRTVGAAQTAVFTVSMPNVTINGFEIDGDDPGFVGTTLESGEDTNASYGVRPVGAFHHVVVRDNIITRVAIGFRGDGLSFANLVAENWFDSVGFYDFGYAVSLRTGYYADVVDNLMTRVWTGVHTNNFSAAIPPAAGEGSASWVISGNEIHSYAGGILYWLHFNSATSALIDNNSVTAETGAVPNNFGMSFVTVQNGVSPTLTNNSVDDTDYGIELTNTSTSNVITLDDTNAMSGTKIAGVYLTDNLTVNPVGTTDLTSNAYTGAANAIAVRVNGMPINVESGTGVKVQNSRTAAADVSSTAEVTGSAISGVGANGVEVIGPLATAHVTGCTIAGMSRAAQVNATNVDAPGSVADPATLTITNSTLSGNTAASGGALNAIGTSGTANVTITNSTLTENSPGGAAILLQDASLIVGNTIFNTGASGTNISALGTSLVSSLGFNLSSDNFGGFLTGTGDQINTDPMLGPLKYNGGPTFTHAPLVNSPAIDQGKDIGPFGPAYTATGEDQRGFARPVDDPAVMNAAGGDGSDIGAIELAPGVHPSMAASRKTHGGAGDFDVSLPLMGAVGIESRGTGAATNLYKIVLTFEDTVTFSGAAVTSGTGMVDSVTSSPLVVDGSPSTIVTINLSGVTDVQTITVALFDTDNGSNISDVGVRMHLRIGDVTGNDVVNSSDVTMVKSQLGEAIDGSNFRTDVNANGVVNASDVTLVKSKIP